LSVHIQTLSPLKYLYLLFNSGEFASHAQEQDHTGVCKVVAILAVEGSSARHEFRVEGKKGNAAEESFALST